MMPQEESDDDYLDDPIRLISNPETGADVVETRVVQIGKEHIKLPVTFFDFPRNIRLLNQCLSMSIKLVDCDKHPWYYKNKVKTPTETIVIDDDSITDCIIIEDKNENMDCKYQSVNNVNISEANKKPKIRPVATPYQNLFDNSKKNALKEKFIITENNWKAKVIKNHSSQDKGVQIDFKRNEGLVGLRLQYTNIGVLKTAKDRTEKEIKEPKNCNPDKHKSSNDTPKSLVELNSKISYTSNIQVSKNSLDKTLNTKSSLPKEAIKVTDGCELNKKESNCIRTDLKSLQGMKILSSDENLKLATKTHISNATKYTKGKKESDKSKCDKLNNNYKHNKNVNKKDSKRSASEITKLSKKKDKKHVNKKHNGFDKVLFKQQQGNLKTCTDKSDATIHVTTIACRDQITNEHNCVVQKDNAKKLFSHKEHDTFSKQSTKPIVAYNQTTNERNCEAQKDNSKSTDATYNQTTHEHNCGAQKDEQKSVVQKQIMEGASNSVEPNITISVKPTSSADISSTANNLNVGQEKSVNTKEKMIEELSKVAFLYSPPQGPVKDLKKSLLETDLHPPASNASNDVKRSKPAPTSKKPNLGLHSSMPQCKPQTLLVPQNGYSPPILPIPTYQRSLEILAKANMAEARMPVNYDEKVTSNIVPRQSEKVTKRKLSLEDCKVDKVKKISLDEYKKRASKHDQQREEEETLEDDVAKKRIRSESTDQDLGYDSDSTVKL
ncbi:uncharacterized protein LOC126370828 [Pectinophora gossypiella]|uniref:uncharacterized protein LOC126370828 n=1 Tax=Pectinophora gossypiella TaxID=13191 RepID=UPI00214E464F|nr:uncharacterized protein LOC126370828 [Pectinophora gossypiella]